MRRLQRRETHSSPTATRAGCTLPRSPGTNTALLLTCSIESNFVLVGVFEQVLGVVEPSSLEPLWDIGDPFGDIHHLEYTPTKHI